MLLRAAEDRYRFGQRASVLGVVQARRSWSRLDLAAIDATGPAVVRQLVSLVAGLQLLQAHGADAYVTAVLAEQGMQAGRDGAVNAAAFTGVASDGRPLTSLLAEPVITTKYRIEQGQTPVDAQAGALAQLERIVATQVQDAGRVATSVATVARPTITGWVRMLNPPSCGPCAELAGRFYRWSSGFDRHPGCDCVNVPSTEVGAADLTTDPMQAFEAGQVHGLSTADTKAIQDGADFSKVVNAHRKGMTFAADFSGHGRYRFTREGTGTKHRRGKPRLMPESIYRIAGDNRAEAIRLLRVHGFIR